jgi:ligand-binding sensor domain-containing protein/serine phosphatase RsbU (regulator of sigma subunit)
LRQQGFRISKIVLIFIGLFSPWISGTFSQNYRFRSYGPEDGLPGNFVYNITQDPNGYIWLGTGEGISRFDGFNFNQSFQGDSLPNSPVRCSFVDSRKLVWFGYDNGSLAVLDGISFRLLEPEEAQRNAIKGFAEDSQGNILVATQAKGIIRVDKDLNLSYITEGLEGQLLTTISITDRGDILAGTFDGLYFYRYDPKNNFVELAGRISEIPYSNIQVIYRKQGEKHFYAGTEDEGLYIVTESGDNSQTYSAASLGNEFGLSYATIYDIYKDGEGNLWLATDDEGVVKLLNMENRFTERIVFNEARGLSTRYIRNIFEDIEGNFWFASYGSGVALLSDQNFTFYSFAGNTFNDDVLSVFVDENMYWLGGEKGILQVDLSGDLKGQHFLGSDYGLPNDKVTAIIKDNEGAFWIGTSKSGIYKLPANATRAQQFFFSPNSLENIINSIQVHDSKLYSATNGGLLIFDLNSKDLQRFTTFEGLPHNRIRQVFIDSKGKTWIATRSNGIYNIESKSELTIESTGELEFVSIAEDKEGCLWAATNGDGVFMFLEDSLKHYSTANGLRSNYCYSLAVDANGMIWVGHSLGMSRIDPVAGKVQVFSVEQGIGAACNYNSVFKNNKDQLVFGTSQGIILYDHTREKYAKTPPSLNITSLKINDQEYDFTKPITLPYNKYRIRIDFIGINIRNPEKVTYQYKLQGYDEWSEITSVPFAYYSRIEDGDFTFLLRACNDQGICTEEAAALVKFDIRIPVWKTWWFISLLIIAVFASIFITVKLRERKQKKIQEYLERLLDERTKEVVAQKEEIEDKNRDITDSINYAQRIQASILPPVSRLLNYFSGSFVFYQPKDIVSGDFYWYDRVWGNKFLIVCADSTGHGVPGAFMSMIGTILIKDICARQEVRSPSSLLAKLDMEIKEALNQNKEAEKSNDGMDIIVAEIDIETKELRVASAMRPLILYINGEQIYVKGSRSSVGGRLDDDMESKVFIDEKFSLSKGDVVYMFSDGYTDQFGGPLGKKFKMVRMKNLLRDIHDKPMDEQYKLIRNNFVLWKENHEQVDDVLLMGIKI